MHNARPFSPCIFWLHPKNRPSLIRSRVLEVAMLVMGGRKKQLDVLKRLKLTEGVPRFEGTPAQLAAYQLVQNFEAKDYELMSRLQQSRDVNKKISRSRSTAIYLDVRSTY